MADHSGDVLVVSPEIAPDEIEHVSIDEDDEPEEETPQAPQRPSRSERRRERGQNIVAQKQAELEAVRAEVAAERQARIDLERRVAEVDARSRQVAEHVVRSQGDPLETAKAPLLQRKKALADEWQALPEDRQRDQNVQMDFHRRAEAMEQELTALRVRAVQPSEEDQQRMVQARVAEARVRELHSRYPEVVGNPRAMAKAQAAYHDAVAEGRPITPDLAEDCFKKAKNWLQGGKPDLPHERVRTGGIPNARGAPAPEGARTVPMTRAMRFIAEQQYSHLPPAQAHKAWAKNDSADYQANLAENRAALARREKA